MITIVDYGLGNLGSIVNMLKRIGVQAKVSSDAKEVADAEKLILPGVGAFDTGMRRLAELGLIEVLNAQVLDHKTPILGLCLGMQLLTRGSEEGTLPGLAWIDGRTVRFHFEDGRKNLKIPHMGWNSISIRRGDTLFRNMGEDPRFYFVHSFHVVCDRPEDVLATTIHGYGFPSAVQRHNIMGTQFHPEKSHRFGMQLLRNFVEIA